MSEKLDESNPTMLAGHGSKLLFVALGVLLNILVGILGIQFSRYSGDLSAIKSNLEAVTTIARTNAANIGLLGKDIAAGDKWNTSQLENLRAQIAGLRERVRELEKRK